MVDLFELAFHLRMPVYKLLEEMPYTELKGWGTYFKKYPVGWREDRRAAVIAQSMGAKFDTNFVFSTLAVIEATNSNNVALLGESLKKSPWMALIESAKGGDVVEGLNAKN